VEDSTWPARAEGHKFGAKPERAAVIITAVLEDLIDPETSENARVDGKVTASNHENATLTKWTRALIGRDITDQPFDTDELVAARALFEVAKNDSGYPHIVGITAMPKAMKS
jgi:hypothetical protein